MNQQQQQINQEYNINGINNRLISLIQKNGISKVCVKCVKAYKKNSLRQEHIQRKHPELSVLTQQCKYLCVYCLEKSFNDNDVFEQHQIYCANSQGIQLTAHLKRIENQTAYQRRAQDVLNLNALFNQVKQINNIMSQNSSQNYNQAVNFVQDQRLIGPIACTITNKAQQQHSLQNQNLQAQHVSINQHQHQQFQNTFQNQTSNLIYPNYQLLLLQQQQQQQQPQLQNNFLPQLTIQRFALNENLVSSQQQHNPFKSAVILQQPILNQAIPNQLLGNIQPQSIQGLAGNLVFQQPINCADSNILSQQQKFQSQNQQQLNLNADLAQQDQYQARNQQKQSSETWISKSKPEIDQNFLNSQSAQQSNQGNVVYAQYKAINSQQCCNQKQNKQVVNL